MRMKEIFSFTNEGNIVLMSNNVVRDIVGKGIVRIKMHNNIVRTLTRSSVNLTPSALI